MTDVIQIFKSVDRIEKPDYDTASRQSVGVWETIVSKTGFLKEDTINLPIECKNDPKVKNADLIIIQDIKGFDPFLVNKSWDSSQFPEWFKNSRKEYLNTVNLHLKGFSIHSKPWTFEIFDMRKTHNDSIEVWLKYSDTIGIPKRENHKIAELKVGKPIRFKINGKADFTLTGRKQRTFSEFDYILEYIGTGDKIEYKELNKIETSKTIPVTDCKVIDERKILT
ncbi:MAG: hypothetical protein K9J27_11310 [Bacteroidales bacterium]|nr:hypothetical protein [Bacteroidales bacterium]